MKAPFDSFKNGTKAGRDRIDDLVSPGIPYWKREFLYDHQPRNGVGIIPLREGLATIVDERDWWEIIRHSWSCTSTKENYSFVRRTFYEDAVHKSILLSRELMKPPRGMVVDHINHDTLDNRRANLRVCSQSQNNMNRRLTGIRAEAPRMVRSPKTGLWNTSIDLEGCILRLHSCKSPDEAKRLLDIAKEALTEAGTQLAA